MNSNKTINEKTKEKKKNDFSYLPFLRNVGIIAHIDSGKTTTTERILYLCKQIHRIGEVHEGSTQTDFMDLERERGITICSACVTVKWGLISRDDTNTNKCTLNIIDTPGHLDFKAEVERSLRVLDGVVLVMDGKEGVEPQTETVWQQANKYKIPRIVFINKLDGVENEERFEKCLVSIKEKLNANPLPLQLPIGAGRFFKGVIDIIDQKSFNFVFGDKEERFVVSEIPDYLKKKAYDYRKKLIESVIEFDDEISFNYLEGKEPTNEQIRFLIRKATLSGRYFPVFAGSAYQDVGINLLLDGIIDYLPSPQEVQSVSVISLLNNKKEEENIEKDQKEISIFSENIPYLALVFKITIDSFGNVLSFIRVYVGKITTNSTIYNSSQNKEERISVLVRLSADKETKISEVKAGEIAAVKGLKYTRTGDTFCDKKKPFLLETIVFDKPVISKAIIPETNKDGEKLFEILKRKRLEDPSINFLKDDKTGQMIIQGLGELHLEILEESLRRDYKLNISTENPKISYKETIKKTVKVTTRYKKQSGGHGHFAEITLIFEPNPEKEEFVFVNKIRGESVPKNFAEATGKGLAEALGNGLLLGFPIVYVKATLIDGLSHDVDSSDKDFKQAAVICCKENKEKFGLSLLEPIMFVSVVVPKEYMGDILANLSSLRMIIENREEDESNVKITGKAPLEKMLSYTSVLRKITKGRGSCTLSLSHYQEVPADVLDKILKEQSVSES